MNFCNNVNEQKAFQMIQEHGREDALSRVETLIDIAKNDIEEDERIYLAKYLNQLNDLREIILKY